MMAGRTILWGDGGSKGTTSPFDVVVLPPATLPNHLDRVTNHLGWDSLTPPIDLVGRFAQWTINHPESR
jgi:hypothetical protein